MRVLLAGLLAVNCAFPLYAQFSDSFNDGELFSNPAWEFDTANFEVTAGKLHSKSAGGGTKIYDIRSRHRNIEESYSFDFEFLTNPSGSNYFDFYMVADSTPLLCNNGYFIRVGNTKDEISFYRKKDGNITELISGQDGELNKSSNIYSVKINRSKAGLWHMYYKSPKDVFWKFQGTITDTSVQSSNYTGIRIYQTGTGVIGKHYFDNIRYGKLLRDTTKPKILNINPSGLNQLHVNFSEPIPVIDRLQFLLEGQNPDSVLINSPDHLSAELFFKSPFAKNKQYHLHYQNIADSAGNFSPKDSMYFFTLQPDTALFHEIIITEIMSNPTPSVNGLPESEYIEIKNTGNRYLKLGGCRLTDGTSSAILPDTVIKPFQYLVLTKFSTAQWPVQNAMVYTGNFPTLNNSSDTILLYNQQGRIICGIAYHDQWHDNKIKQSGGWSLELKDTTMFCIPKDNWKSNQSSGGTPGHVNSTAAQLENIPRFQAIRSELKDDSILVIYFNLLPDSASLKSTSISDPDGMLKFQQLSNVDYLKNALVVRLESKITDFRIHQVRLSNIKSCSGALLENTTISFGRSIEPKTTGQLMINELMFNPYPDDPDFIELYNNTDTILSLDNLFISNGNAANSGTISNTGKQGYLIFPHNYLALTTLPETVMSRYQTHNIRNIASVSFLPSMPNEGGYISILTRNGTYLDSMHYSDDMHSPVVNSGEGISLEKTNPRALSNEFTYWTSASFPSGGATPGTVNSQVNISKSSQKHFQLVETFFSPDNDGSHDYLTINYNTEKPGYILNSWLFSENGYAIGPLHKSMVLGWEGVLHFDGKTSEGQLTPGNYVIKIEAFHPSGDTIHTKLTFSVLTSQW